LRQAGAGTGDITRRVTLSDLGLASNPVLATVKPELQKKEPDPFSIIGVYRGETRSEYPVPRP